ncbi:MAG: DUF1134 domain-containing protein [Hyphomicrobiaceae bacterium]
MHKLGSASAGQTRAAVVGLKAVVAAALLAASTCMLTAQERLPWLRDQPQEATTYDNGAPDVPREPAPAQAQSQPYVQPQPYINSAPRAGSQPGRISGYPTSQGSGYDQRGDVYQPGPSESSYLTPPPSQYSPPSRYSSGYNTTVPRYDNPAPGYGASSQRYDNGTSGPNDRPWAGSNQTYDRPASSVRPDYRDDQGARDYNDRRYYDDERRSDGTFSMREIVDAGQGFFGSISQGLASVIEYAFKSQGRPNGYILGEDAGGAFVAGLRYGEGRLYTRDAGNRKVYWQGPSIGYDAGAEGSKVMVLVYRMREPGDIFQRFGGVDGSAYVVGGVGLTFLSRDKIVLAPIRAGVGLRLGANVGYLKYTRRPTWNPF